MTSSLELMSRGRKFLVVLFVTILLSLALRDLVLALASLAMLTILLVDVLLLLKRSGRIRGEVEPSSLRLRIRAGSSHTVQLFVKSRVDCVKLGESYDWIKCSSASREELTTINLRVEPRSHGKYFLDGLRAELYSNLKLMRLDKKLNFKLELTAYPKVLPWLLRVLEFLYGAEGVYGELPSKITGVGFEYYGTREFALGDNPKLMDWKATAKLLKLMVKEFLRERAGLSVILYNDECLGPSTRDEQSSLLLSSLLALAMRGEAIGGLVIKSGLKVLFTSFRLSPHEALKVALAHILESNPLVEPLLYDVFEPKPASRIVKMLRKLRAEGLERIAKHRLKAEVTPIGSIAGPYTKLGDNLLYVGTAVCDSRFLLEVAYAALTKGYRITVLTPARPWLDSPPEDVDRVRLLHS
ncbi:MAG: hypothetical protein DRJ68_03500, partial [Thermoprotei archaeon]